MRLLEPENAHVISYLRWSEGHILVVIANFSDAAQTVNMRRLRTEGLAHFFKDKLSQRTLSTHDILELEPYELLWLVED
ncbi:alpha-glucosidase C-terminal domain-containing protein [Coraliomargarita algicola]|uniref:Alpha-glucosidase C-terminal domain-containing protein n=1 Tax=Coraliomargarita algicola TaxID=3092156 RepID=A0ABZ0RF41_9BACT|nr:alpha-glucosidase C-terminal domain-containing protein [Coraliomargarita sp. J2-16]WPJ94661.1 alpha-glucosidase C-terminal domain-containing protein [Coraliomargarita sp. J2-16]